jgi:AraC family transcriptional regulator
MDTMTPDCAPPAGTFQDISPLCINLLHQAALLLRSDNPTAMQFISKANTLLNMSPVEAGPRRYKGGLSLRNARKITLYIEENLHRSIKIEELAGICNRSVGGFSINFKSTFGMSPHAYILKQRIEIAKRAILETDNALCDIAVDCGLSDQSHLTRLFKKLVGVPPGIWRRQGGHEVKAMHQSDRDHKWGNAANVGARRAP